MAENGTPKTEYMVFKKTTISPDPDTETDLTAYVHVGNASAHGPRQAMLAVASRIESIDGFPATDPRSSRLGPYRAAPVSSWHEHEVVEKPAELAIA